MHRWGNRLLRKKRKHTGLITRGTVSVVPLFLMPPAKGGVRFAHPMIHTYIYFRPPCGVSFLRRAVTLALLALHCSARFARSAFRVATRPRHPSEIVPSSSVLAVCLSLISRLAVHVANGIGYVISFHKLHCVQFPWPLATVSPFRCAFLVGSPLK